MAELKLARAAAFAAAALLSAGTASQAGAATIFSTTLLGANEVPPVAGSGSGAGRLTLADDMNSFSVLIDFSGLSSNAVAGHVHCCSSSTGTAPVAIGFTVPSATAGAIMGSYDLTLASTYTSAFLTGAGGAVTGARSTFLAGLFGGQAYLNVHTVANPGGEIRGQLPAVAVAAVPEPATWATMLLGFGMVGGAIRLRRRSQVTTRVSWR